MRNFIEFIVKMFIAAIVAMVVVCVLIMHDASDAVCMIAYVSVSIAVAAMLGAFSDTKSKQSRFGTIRHKGVGYRKAA